MEKDSISFVVMNVKKTDRRKVKLFLNGVENDLLLME